ncbi:WAT1-related protein, partial [Mucuna pruriens]
MSAGNQIGRMRLLFTNIKPYLLMIALQFGMAGNYIFGKDVLNHGMSRFVKSRPKMTLPVFLQIIVLGFLEPVFNQSFNYLGMKYTSASFTSTIVNAVPSFTFLLAVIVR